MEKIEIEVGRGLRDAAADVSAAWKAAEAGRPVEPSNRIYVPDWDTLSALLTPKRREMLRHLRSSHATGIRALARTLDRDVKRVHEDVVALTDLSLIERDQDGCLFSRVDEIALTVRLRSAGEAAA